MPEPSTATRWTIRDVIGWTVAHFQRKGIRTARLDAEVLLAHSLGVNRLYLYLNLDRPLALDERKRYRELVQRRSRREPVAYLVGEREFWSLTFRIRPGVLIPRPETELLVNATVREIRNQESPLVLEIGTGSGAVAVAVAREVPQAWVVATDISLSALALAQLNAEQCGVRDRIHFVASDLFSGFKGGHHFHVICSNPPYIPSSAIEILEPEIRDYEPRHAIDGGPDGLDVIRALITQAPRYLKSGGCLMTEIGENQETRVREMFLNLGGFKDIKTLRDLASLPRVVCGRS